MRETVETSSKRRNTRLLWSKSRRAKAILHKTSIRHCSRTDIVLPTGRTVATRSVCLPGSLTIACLKDRKNTTGYTLDDEPTGDTKLGRRLICDLRRVHGTAEGTHPQ